MLEFIYGKSKQPQAIDVIELHMVAGLDSLRLRTPLRFDYDPRNAAQGHPSCHLHMIQSYCRCPVIAPVTIGHFVHFVFRHFYPTLWFEHEFFQSLPRKVENRTITQYEESDLHFGCSRIGSIAH
jgi:hypothetical protein